METSTVEKTLQQIAEEIAKALGPKWKRSTKFDEDDRGDRVPWRARIEGENEEALFLSNTWGPKGMLHVSGWPPDYIYRQSVSIGTAESINVSLNKTPEQMARDIERRLLPSYREHLAKILEKHAKDVEYKKGVKATKARVAEVLNGRYKDDSEMVYGKGSTDVQVCGPDSLRFSGHCFYFNVDQLERIRKAVPELFEREKV